jgi:ketosteroid isomerase-like protein
MHPDVTVKSLLTEPEQATWHGQKDARKWLKIVRDFFPDLEAVQHEAVDLGDCALIHFEIAATFAGGGIPIRQSFWNVSRVRDGRIVWFAFYRTRDDALDSVRTQPGRPPSAPAAGRRSR